MGADQVTRKVQVHNAPADCRQPHEVCKEQGERPAPPSLLSPPCTMLLRGTGAYTEMPDLFSRVDSSGAVQIGCLNKLHADAATASLCWGLKCFQSGSSKGLTAGAG